VVADGGRRKLSVVADGAPAKGRRYSTFTHTERALVATIYLSDRMHWIYNAYAKHIHIPTRIYYNGKTAY